MSTSGYSSKIMLTLIACGVELTLSHVGSEFVIVKNAIEPIASCNAEIVVSVDGETKSRPVFLPHGISSGTDTQVLYL